jgi:valine--pyruvate aminotransferase
MNLSDFGERLCAETGIGRLMHDLGAALAKADADTCMLGGGNPGHIPEVEAILRQNMQKILDTPGEFEHALGDYVTPRGDEMFIGALVDLLNEQFDWKVTPSNVVLTNGSQTGFFMLFNMLAGQHSDGTRKKILFPLCPEYIGYSDLGLADDFFIANKPGIELIDDHTFKYHVNFETLEVGEDIAAICVSRPTNPTGNVVTDQEVDSLRAIAREKNIPLIIDNAYGAPFPNVIFSDVTPVWDEGMIMCMTLSKVGLPGARTGIMIAPREIATAIANMNAVLSLAPGSLGSALAYELVKSGEITRISREIINPFYRAKSVKAYEQFVGGLNGLDVFLHKPEGSMFLWIWMRDLPITDQELYARLKDRGVLVVPGSYFFQGLQEDWRHRQECIRVTFTQDEEMVERGIAIICDEIRNTYSKA